MLVDKTQIGLTFPSARMPRARQEVLIRAAGATRIIHVGVDCASWRDVVRITRHGDTIYVVALVLVPTARTKDEVSPADQPGEIIADFGLHGVTIHEALTGLRSDDRDQRRQMLKSAAKGIRGGGRRFPEGVRERGRPSADCSAVLEQCRKIWTSRAYATNDDAVAHMPPCVDRGTGEPVPWTTERAYRAFKASGRPFPKRRKSAKINPT